MEKYWYYLFGLFVGWISQSINDYIPLEYIFVSIAINVGMGLLVFALCLWIELSSDELNKKVRRSQQGVRIR